MSGYKILKISFVLISSLHIAILAEELCDKAALHSGTCVLSTSENLDRYSSEMAEMKVVRVAEFGDESKLKVVMQDVPAPQANEVLIKVEAIGVNPVEVMIRSGSFGDMVKPPYVPGTDVAGVVEKVGAGVTKVKKGDRVYAINTVTGAYAEFCTAPVDFVSPLHDRLSFDQGAALGLPYTVAYKALFIRAHSKQGETVLVHGASGGVGIAAVQMAKANGLTVIGTAGSADGMALVKSQGADFVFNHSKEGYMTQVKEATKGKGVNVILEMLADKNLVNDLGIVASRGRIVVIGCKGSISDFNPSLTMGVEADIMGMVVQVSTKEEYQEMLSAINQGQGSWVSPQIAKKYSLEQASQAHKDIAANANSKGKLIINPKL